MSHRSSLAAGKKAVVLLSGGLDSATTLYIAQSRGFNCACLIFDYGQRHKREIEYAKKIAKAVNCPWRVIKIELPWKGSSLLNRHIAVPKRDNSLTSLGAGETTPRLRSGQARQFLDFARGGRGNKIPTTYVPGRNIIFLSFALSFAESIGAQAIFIGAHAQDYPGYPDCRPEFLRAFGKVISSGTKAALEKRKIEIKAPLINKTKAEIIKLGSGLNVPFGLTWSCYRGGRVPCGACDSCYYRQKGFKEAGVSDSL